MARFNLAIFSVRTPASFYFFHFPAAVWTQTPTYAVCNIRITDQTIISISIKHTQRDIFYLVVTFVLLLCSRRDVDSLSRWQCDFRDQIRALRQWLKNMEMRLPPVDPGVRLVCGLFHFCRIIMHMHVDIHHPPYLCLSFRNQHLGKESAIVC